MTRAAAEARAPPAMIEMETEPWEIEGKLAPSLNHTQPSCFYFLCELCVIRSVSGTVVGMAPLYFVNFFSPSGPSCPTCSLPPPRTRIEKKNNVPLLFRRCRR